MPSTDKIEQAMNACRIEMYVCCDRMARAKNELDAAQVEMDLLIAKMSRLHTESKSIDRATANAVSGISTPTTPPTKTPSRATPDTPRKAPRKNSASGLASPGSAPTTPTKAKTLFSAPVVPGAPYVRRNSCKSFRFQSQFPGDAPRGLGKYSILGEYDAAALVEAVINGLPTTSNARKILQELRSADSMESWTSMYITDHPSDSAGMASWAITTKGNRWCEKKFVNWLMHVVSYDGVCGSTISGENQSSEANTLLGRLAMM